MGEIEVRGDEVGVMDQEFHGVRRDGRNGKRNGLIICNNSLPDKPVERW